MKHYTSGFSVALSEAQAAALARHPLVEFVEEVAVLHESSERQLPANNSLWNLDRLDQNTPTLNQKYDYCEKGGGVTAYVIGRGVYRDHNDFSASTGGSRVVAGTKYASDNSTFPGNSSYPPDPPNSDYGYWPCNSCPSPYTSCFPDSYSDSGHETAVASILGGNTLGVASGVKIVPIRIYDCNGISTTENSAYAFDWIMSTSNTHRLERPAVVNYSSFAFYQNCDGSANTQPTFVENEINRILGHPYWNGACHVTPNLDPYDSLTNWSPDWSGIPVVVSANNQNASDGAATSPARMAFTNTTFATCGHVISVGGTDENDQRWVCNAAVESCLPVPTKCSTFSNPATVSPGSNYGYTVDIFAPAHNITAASNACPTCTIPVQNRRSGTSYAAPLVAGIVARMQVALGAMSPESIWSQLQRDASFATAEIDPITHNRMIAHRDGAQYCSPELP